MELSVKKKGRPTNDFKEAQERKNSELLKSLVPVVSPVGPDLLQLSPVNFTEDDRIKTLFTDGHDLLVSLNSGTVQQNISAFVKEHCDLQLAKSDINMRLHSVAILMANILFKEYNISTITNDLQVALVTHFTSYIHLDRRALRCFRTQTSKFVANIVLVVSRV
jgi:hypothetical protein